MFSVRVEGWDEFARDLRVLGQTEAHRQIVAELRPFAGKIAAGVRSRAHRHIAPAVRVGSRGGLPSIIVDGTKAPDNRLWEFGGRHPVFGNDEAWVYQSPRPYVGPEMEARSSELQGVVAKGLDKALSATGWA